MKLRSRFWGLLAFFILSIVLGRTLLRPYRFDLAILLEAARHLWRGEPVYRIEVFADHTKPPLLTLLFLPWAFLNEAWVARFWDLLNVATGVAIAFWLATQMQVQRRWLVTLLLLLSILNAWNAEIALGQYNLLGLGAMILAHEASASAAGFWSFFALALKPSNLILWPWALGRRAGPVVAFTAGVTLFFSIVYAGLFGGQALITDTLSWLRFLGPVTQKHLLQSENDGLPGVLARWTGLTSGLLHQALLFSAVAFGAWATRRFSKLDALALSSAAVVVASPLSWHANYTLLMPLVAALGMRITESATARVGLGILYIGTQIYNPALFGRELHARLLFAGIPFWALVAALVIYCWTLTVVG